jgi:NAD(P)H dehydrogenase (quinone)
MTRRILVFDGHPGQHTLSAALCAAYADAAAAAGHAVRMVNLHGMSFDPDFGQAHYDSSKPLEPSLTAFLADVEWAEHLVIAMPLWWGGMPAMLKGLFDRTLLPGRAFDPRIKVMGLPKPLLTGRTARVLITSDTPDWALKWIYHSAVVHQVKRQILGFVGIRPARFTHFPVANAATVDRRKSWLMKAASLGRQAR